MNKKKTDFTVIILSLLFLFFLIFSNKLVLESVNFSISIWKDNLFPTLFPFFIVSNILIQYGFVDIIGNIFSKSMQKIFKLPGNSSYVLINSLFSGFPSGAKYTVTLVKEKVLTINDASRLLTFTNYSNPLFIIGFIGNMILNKKTSILILISHILGGLIVGLIFSFNKENNNIQNKSIKKADKKITFGTSLSTSIYDSLNTMFLLLGIVTIFTIITSIISNVLNLNIYLKTILSGILEMTQGIKNLNTLNISIFLKTILVTFFISFGGLSVHIQVLSIISEYNIKYKPFFIARLIHSVISCGLVSILYYITY